MTDYKDKAIKIEKSDLPALYHTATIASGNAQETFLLLIKASIFFLSLGAIFSAINITGFLIPYAQTISILIAVTLIISVAITVVIELAKYEKKWYDGRAIAESVKTLSWRFMMNAEPYYTLKQESENRLRKDLTQIKDARKSFGELLGGDIAIMDQITETMRSLKKSDLDTRKGTYQANRIGSQKKWYADNSKNNRMKGEGFFWALIIFQIIAIVSALIIAQIPGFILNPTGVVTTIVAGIIAWMQVKQYKNLAESYGLTSQELGIIESKIAGIKKNSEFADFVVESETAISREHTMWLARRTSD